MRDTYINRAVDVSRGRLCVLGQTYRRRPRPGVGRDEGDGTPRNSTVVVEAEVGDGHRGVVVVVVVFGGDDDGDDVTDGVRGGGRVTGTLGARPPPFLRTLAPLSL